MRSVHGDDFTVLGWQQCLEEAVTFSKKCYDLKCVMCYGRRRARVQ